MDMKPSHKDARDIEEIFGVAYEDGLTFEEAALKSDRLFVRSQDHLAFDNETANGVRLSAYQALTIFGPKKLREIVDYGSAIIPVSCSEPAASIKQRRESLGLSTALVAKKAGVTEEDVLNAEDLNRRNSMQALCRIAQTLCMDDMAIAFHPTEQNDTEFAYRLRDRGTLAGSRKQLTLGLNEAAWVIKKQLELSAPNRSAILQRFEPSSIYGDKNYPVWKQGYYLAEKTRELLDLGHDPIQSIRGLLEKKLGIPLVQLELPDSVAGGTVSFDQGRGIFLNINGGNNEVGVRRFTLAHELGHLLWDPDQKLRSIIVDEYKILEPTQTLDDQVYHDFVEARANAFAIEFLAPGKKVEAAFRSESSASAGLKKVMEIFGLSYTAARFHILNSCKTIDLEQLTSTGCSVSSDWQAQESFTIDFFKPESVPFSRRGRFAYEVVMAEEMRKISTNAAAIWLGCSTQEYQKDKETIKSLFA
ncbi:MAG TPA: ImmA/IrrE family metallo-endopeptidase [Candidatus Rifleibacterium sp.]|nr:ImmA/IrrE family metallo-endopeptidase [Candidatus Rifleibacterium sp.]